MNTITYRHMVAGVGIAQSLLTQVRSHTHCVCACTLSVSYTYDARVVPVLLKIGTDVRAPPTTRVRLT